jgi:hypothetical protein
MDKFNILCQEQSGLMYVEKPQLRYNCFVQNKTKDRKKKKTRKKFGLVVCANNTTKRKEMK